MTRMAPYAALAGMLFVTCASAVPRATLPLDQIRLPPGFAIALFADGTRGARAMTVSLENIVYVGTRGGSVYALPDRNRDGRADEVLTIARGLNAPSGVAWHDGALYVAEIHRVIRFDGIDARLANPPEPQVVNASLPRDQHHGAKHLRIGPDEKLYVPVGAPCNVCLKDDPRYGALLKMSLDGSGLEVFASGIRNTVGFDWHPVTKELWFTDNGRDNLGDDVPPDELNHAEKPGLHFGFPFCHGGDIADPDFGGQRRCDEFVPPVQKLGPHVASLGMRFYTGSAFPPEYRNQIFIAEHGSWNRSTPIGYRITLVTLEGGTSQKYETFAEGWLQRGTPWGRPVDVLVMPDGALLVSDDHAGVVYRISYAKK